VFTEQALTSGLLKPLLYNNSSSQLVDRVRGRSKVESEREQTAGSVLGIIILQNRASHFL
jgi:hypothetical protein